MELKTIPLVTVLLKFPLKKKEKKIGYGNNQGNLTEPQSVLLAYAVSSL